ncbi:hypothetical protein C8F04DRAFT_1359135 [Mycena alexandri]|uniref:Uncharacterized protein n=1 Tax=Mycena alexandri TaxID=1745969 RepID=A0AAD6X1H0_9AGAR|nr:hypothetical protein C8F04DRAFT_1359135 [Mycena alexandri]
MPELAEAVASGKLSQLFIQEQPLSSCLVKALLADPTQPESSAHPPGSRAASGHVYALESSSAALRGSCSSQTPIYPPLYATNWVEPPVPILKHGLTLVAAETHPRNVLLKFEDNQGRTYWLQVQLLKHTITQIYNKVDWDEAICVVDSLSRGFKIGIAIEFEHHVLAFTTLDLLIQFYWAETREALPAQQPDVYLEFPRFLEDLVAWIERRRTVQSHRAGNAMTLVRNSTEIFSGAGAYTLPEIWHMAGLSPNLTEAEVFDSPSRVGRLCGAYYHLGKEVHTTLWPFVQRFLVDYVICVRDEHRRLYSDRLHVYGKDRAYVTSRFSELLVDFKEVCESHSSDDLWIREFDDVKGPFDVFEPDLIRHALENEEVNLGSLIFGPEKWAELHSHAGLPASCLRSDDVLSKFFSTTPIPANMSATWLSPFAYRYLFNDGGKAALQASHPTTLLYRASATNIWSVIPAYPPNSAPILRPKPPQLPKALADPSKAKRNSTSSRSRVPPRPKTPVASKAQAPLISRESKHAEICVFRCFNRAHDPK